MHKIIDSQEKVPPTLCDDMWLDCEQVFNGKRIVDHQILHVSGNKVVGLKKRQDVPKSTQLRKIAGCVSVGYFDIQVNGGGGVMLNTTPSVQGINKIAAAHRKFGTTALFPTVITDAPEVLEAAIDAVAQSIHNKGVAGVHIEGPHISRARHGAHLQRFIRPLDDVTILEIRKLRDAGIPVLITLAPESVTSGQIASLVDMGVVVSIGHSNCSAEQANAALDEGVSLFTHLFNAMSPMENRAPGLTGAAINSSVYCSFICDGFHVDDTMLGLAFRARPVPDRMVLISDAMSTIDGEDRFELYGDTVNLVDGRLVNSQGSLAGAHTTMAWSLARLVNQLNIPLEQALRMAITNPAQLMGLPDQCSLLGKNIGDLLLINADTSSEFLIQS